VSELAGRQRSDTVAAAAARANSPISGRADRPREGRLAVGKDQCRGGCYDGLMQAGSQHTGGQDGLGSVLVRWVALMFALGAVSVLHYATSAEHAWLHNIYQRLYYAPIVLGAYWFGVRGGLLTAVAAAVAYVPHISHTWGHNAPYAASQYAELVIFPSAGLLIGLLADTQRKLTRQYQRAAVSLEAANRELVESHEQLKRADRLSALGEIAAGLAHEIRNPLAGIKGALEIVQSRVNAGTPEAEFSGIAATEVGRLDSLVAEFLTYARPREPEFREGRLDDVIDHVLALLKPEAERANIRIERDAGVPLPVVRMDSEQIQQVIFNVVLNGIQAGPPGSTLSIRTSYLQGWATVEVVDRGPGVAAEHRHRLFDPFFTTKTHGTGLGLAVSQRIMAAHGGRIDISAAADGDTVARISLPAPLADHPATR
jgi:two-component system, NtrC family, sensor histidine kinase HydH